MVFNKFTHLARPSLSKTFAHGYAQSVVAATQSTTPFSPLGKHTTNKSGRPNTAQQHVPYSNTATANVPHSKAAQHTAETTQHHDGGLKAYYDAWQKLQQHGGEGKEWRQYQFPKLIEPKAPSHLQDGTPGEHTAPSPHLNGSADRVTLDRAYSTSAVEDIKKAQDEAEEAAVAKVDEAIATVIKQIENSSAEQDVTRIGAALPAQKDVDESTRSNREKYFATSISPDGIKEGSSRSTPSGDATAATSIESDPDPTASLQHIKALHDAQAYKDVPPAFESMLSRGIQPTAEAYNALLASAIHLYTGRLHVIPKALDIYSDMLRRKISPDTDFYSSLIQMLSRHTLHVEHKKAELRRQSKRYSGVNSCSRFLLPSDATEYSILAEDDSFINAVRLFDTAILSQKPSPLTPQTYQLFILACAQKQEVERMVRAYQLLEAQQVPPAAAVFPAMIGAFAKSGDLGSALECYNEYRSLAIADDAGHLSILSRNDGEVYAALIRAYSLCDKSKGGERFFRRIVDSFATDTKERQLQLVSIQDTVNIVAFVQSLLDAGDFAAAMSLAEDAMLSPQAREQAYMKICVVAADNSNEDAAHRSHHLLTKDTRAEYAASIAMFALYIRKNDLEAVNEYWKGLTKTDTALDPSFIIPTVSYALALICDDQVDAAMSMARKSFSRMRTSLSPSSSLADLGDQIDEAIEVIARSVSQAGKPIPPYAGMTFLYAMMENGGLIHPVAEQVLGGIGLDNIRKLRWEDIILLLEVQAGLIGNSVPTYDPSHITRFGDLLDISLKMNANFDERTMELVETAVRKVSTKWPGILRRWNNYKLTIIEPAQPSFTPLPSRSIPSAPALTDSYDPYSVTTDYRGSTIILEELENRRNGHGLNEALTRFRNIRRAGRHPRYIAYAKLIMAATKEGRINLTHDILGMARNDIPLILQYPVVRHGWSSILDAMVGACLTAGKRNLAAQYHQELLEMGSAPTANTYGLYITTLKESTKTFDEATEAVKVFHRAISEGVLPSSFLYNALIGKLGKARRIDDCLRYFQEMRVAGIRPTSVTYGTIVNALCRVSDERFAEELFDEMESMPNYKPRPAPYNSLMQYFLTTKRDSQKVLAYYDRMQAMNIQPTMHTYKLLIDTYATLEPVNLKAAEGVFDIIRAQGLRPEAIHYASLIHAKGCALHDLAGARDVFEKVLASAEVRPQACLYQALFESMVANHCVAETEEVLDSMSANCVEMTPYIANTLIHGWAMEHQIAKSKAIYDSVSVEKREPSTYESMTRAFLTAGDRKSALATIHEMLSRGYPSAVTSKILELVGHGMSRAVSVVRPDIIA